MNKDNHIAIQGIYLTKESIDAIKFFQFDDGERSHDILDEVVDILLEEVPADKDYKRRIDMIQDIRFIDNKLLILSNSHKSQQK